MISVFELIPEIFDYSGIPKTLYHYTTVKGFFEIVRSRSIWATDYRYFNDTDEILDLFKHVAELQHFKNSQTPNVTGEELFNKIHNYFGVPNHTIISFSEHADDLAMWGRYSNDEGLSVGFNTHNLTYFKSKEDNHKKPMIGKCIYLPKSKMEIIDRIIKNSKETTSLLISLVHIAAFFKNESFAGEAEWRFVFENRYDKPEGYGRPNFRISKNKIIPYMSIRLDKEVDFELSEIITSPILSRSPMAENMIKEFLHAHNAICEKIIKSKSTLV